MRALVRDGSSIEQLRRELDATPSPRTFFFRDDDAGWASERLLALLDLFARYSVPLDLAVIPAALDGRLAASLRRRPEVDRGLLAFHQHGFAHANHESSGRPCEFGPERPAGAQQRDIEAGARRLRKLLGETAPIFSPPWNRCTTTTGRCLVELGFRALSRDTSAAGLDVVGLQEINVHDWSKPDAGQRLTAGARTNASTGVMLHHEHMGTADREQVERLLALLTSHRNARCVALRSLTEDVRIQAPRSARNI